MRKIILNIIDTVGKGNVPWSKAREVTFTELESKLLRDTCANELNDQFTNNSWKSLVKSLKAITRDNPNVLRGVASSLIQKGIFQTDGKGADEFELTELGSKALVLHLDTMKVNDELTFLDVACRDFK